MADAESTQTLSSLITGQPAAPKNPYDDAANEVMSGQSAVIRNNVYNAIPQNAAQVSEHAQLAGQLNIPVQSVQSDPMTAKQRAAMQNMDVQKVVTNHPHLADFMTDPTNAAQVTSNGDVPNMANTEQAVKNVPQSNAIPDTGQYLVPLPDKAPTLRDRLHDLVAGWIGGPSAAQEHQGQSAAEANAILAARQSNPDLIPKPNATPADIAKLNDLAWQQSNAAVGAPSLAPQIAAEHAVSSATFGLVSPVAPTQSHSTSDSIAGGVGTLAGFFGGPVAAAKAIMGLSPAATAALTTNAGDAWALSLLKNVTQQSATLALASGAQQAGTSALDSHSVDEGVSSELHAVKSGAETGAVFGALGKVLPDNTLPQWLARFGGASALQDLLNGQTPWDDRTPGQKVFDYGQNAFFTMHGGGRSDGGWFSNDPTVKAGVANANKAATAVRGGEALQQLSSAAANTQLRTNNPQAFHDFVQKVTDNGHLPEVYVDGQTLVNALHQSGVPLEELQAKMPQLSEQLQEALHTNGDVKIDTADYATNIAGTPLDAAILPHLKTDPEGMTYAQGQEHLANQQAEMTQQAQDILNRQQVAAERDQQLKSIQDDVQRQLVATTRYTTGQAKQYGALHSAFFDNAAERMGITPAEMRERMPLKITGDALGGDTLNQDPNSYYDERVDNNKQGLTDGNEEHVIEGTVAKRSEAEVDHEQNEFLSNFQKGQRYARSNPRLAGLRESSDQASLDIGGDPKAERVVKSPLGPFSEYKTAGQVIHGRTHAEDKLQVHVYGKEQNEAGLTDTPALTLTVDKSGELSINGPHYLSKDLNEFIARGWADHAVGKDGEVQHGWTRLQNPDSPNKQLPFEQLKPLLADMHARLLAWDDKDYAGLHWGRATGATGGDGEGRKTAVFFQPAYHGSPHDFDKFSTDRIGTGEGNQSYGHGLYFAENKDVAKEYQKALSDFDMKVDGEDYDDDIPEHRAAYALGESSHAKSDVVERIKRSIADLSSRGKQWSTDEANRQRETLSVLESGKDIPKFELETKGNLYQVDIPDEHVANFLRWDKPLSEQPDAARNVLEKAGVSTGESAADLEARMKSLGYSDEDAAAYGKDNAYESNGHMAYNELAKKLGSSEAASRYLSDAGIKGIKYLDGNSRTVGEGSSNLVVFDDKIINLTHKDGSPVSPAEREAYMQPSTEGNRGFYNPATGEMGLLKDADLSTFLHESGHYFLETMHEMAQHPDAPQGVKEDFDTLLQHFKVGGETPEDRMLDWSTRDLEGKRDGHEQFATDFEKYLFEGKAPTPELQSMFSRFRSWLMSVYQSLRGELSPEVKSVFDRMFASQEAITEAERVRGYFTPDLPAEHGELTDQFKAQSKEATEQAIAELQARSLRDMKWMSNAKSKAMRELQRSAKDARTTIKDEVTKEVMEQPVNQARTFLTKGEMHDQEGNLIKAEKGYKLNTNDLRQMFPKESLTPLDLNELRGMTSEDGLHPDMVADIFGFDSGRTLIGALTHRDKPADQIKGITDQRMLERHGDLVDPVSIERAAEAAIHNEARARMMATGLKMFAKSPMSEREINKAAKVAADTAIAAKKVGDLRPAQYSAAESKAGKEFYKLAPRDPAGAAAAQRAQLLNNRLYKSAVEAIAEVRAIPTYVKRLTSITTLKKIAPEERGLILGLLKNYDFRINPTDEPTRGQKNLQQWIDAQTAAGYMPTVSPDALNAQPRTHYRDMTVEQIRGLRDTLKSLEFQGKNANKLDILGDKVDKREYIDTHLIPKLKEAGENYSLSDVLDHPENQEKGPIAAALAKITGWMSAGHESTLPPAHRAIMLDRQEINGPFQESLINPMMDAAVHEARMNKAVTDKANEGAKSLGKDWQKSRYEMVPNTVLLDAQATKEKSEPVFLKITRDNLVSMLVHSGNESNFDKMVKGREWDPQTVTKFINDNITAKDLEAANRIWGMAAMHWDDQVKQAERLGAILPPKVEARPFETSVGHADGGYAPLRYDPLRSRQGAKAEQATEVSANDNMRSAASYMDRQSTISGSLHARNDGYTDVVDLRLQRLQDAIREDIHDLAFREPIINANKILNDSPFRTAFKLAHGPAEYKAMTQYIDQFVNSAQADKAADWLDATLKYTRTGMVANAIGFRATTVLKHGLAAAVKSSGEFPGTSKVYFLKRLASMVTDHDNQVATAMQNSGEIYTRLLQFDRDYTAAMGNLLDPESMKAKSHRFGHFAVAWFDQFTAVPTFHAAYDRAVTEGIPVKQGGTGEPMTDAQARAYADNVVRRAHGGSTDATRSNLMNSKSESVKMLTMMYQFMNNSYGQMSNTISALRTPGISKPEVLGKAFVQQIMPALMTALVTKGLWDKKDDIWKWVGEAILDEQVASLPGGASLLAVAKDQSHAGQLAPMAFAESVTQPGKDLWKVAHGEIPSKPIQDVGNALGVLTGYSGFGAGAKTLQYADDMRTGKERPNNALEAAQGLTIGVHHPKK